MTSAIFFQTPSDIFCYSTYFEPKESQCSCEWEKWLISWSFHLNFRAALSNFFRCDLCKKGFKNQTEICNNKYRKEYWWRDSFKKHWHKNLRMSLKYTVQFKSRHISEGFSQMFNVTTEAIPYLLSTLYLYAILS